MISNSPKEVPWVLKKIKTRDLPHGRAPVTLRTRLSSWYVRSPLLTEVYALKEEQDQGPAVWQSQRVLLEGSGAVSESPVGVGLLGD